MLEIDIIIAAIIIAFPLWAISGSLDQLDSNMRRTRGKLSQIAYEAEDIAYGNRVRNKRLNQLIKIYKSYNKRINKKDVSPVVTPTNGL